MIIKEIKEKLGTDRFIKISIIIGFILLTTILYFIKFELKINWELVTGILGFYGVIITIKETDKFRIEQNKFDYQKEKINEEQIEFKKMLKEKIDFLNFTNLCKDFFFVDSENYLQELNKINAYRNKMVLIKDDIFWYYDKETMGQNYELGQLMFKIIECINFYNEKMASFCSVILKYGKENPNYTEIQAEQFKITNELNQYNMTNISGLYEQAKKVVEERDRLVRKKIIE